MYRPGMARRALGTVLVMLVLRLPAAAAVGSQPGPDAKSLARLHDPVIVRTGLLAEVPDRETARYRMYAVRNGSAEPIPFQFDARGPDGEIVLSDDGTDADFTFDEDDELVFMAKDSGDRVGATALPATRDAVLEIEVRDPRRGAQGWAYLVHFPAAPPPRSPVRYATFDPVRQEAHAASYEVTYSRDRSNFLNGVRIPPSAGGTGASLFGRIRMRISPTFAFLFATFRPTFTEESFSVVPDGLKNGPVRAVRRVRQSLNLGAAFPDIPNGRVDTYYYASSFRTPSRFSIPWLALKVLRDFRFESVDAFGADTGDLRYWDAANPQGVRLAAGDRPVAADSDHDWWVVSGERGTWLHALVIPEQWRAWGIKRGIVMEDGGAGYSLLRMTHLRKAGDYLLGSALIVMPRPYQPGDEVDALAGLREPLETHVRKVGSDAGVMRRAAR
jgi:hypothetical protein